MQCGVMGVLRPDIPLLPTCLEQGSFFSLRLLIFKIKMIISTLEL